jgi:Flp pilus assembly pilin Flp
MSFPHEEGKSAIEDAVILILLAIAVILILQLVGPDIRGFVTDALGAP